MGTKIKSPVGKYFKTEHEHYYCYEENTMFRGGWNFICVDENSITTHYFSNILGLPRSTRKAFLKAYARTIEAIGGIVEGGK